MASRSECAATAHFLPLLDMAHLTNELRGQQRAQGSLNWLVHPALALSHTSSPELQPSTGWSAGQPHCTALRSTNGNLAFGWWQVGLLDWKSPQMPVQQRTRSFINPSRAVVTGNLSD